jgi:hypothetical protein
MMLPRHANIDAMALNAAPNSSATLQVPVALQVQRSKDALRAEEEPRQLMAGIKDSARAAEMDQSTAEAQANALAMYTAAEVSKMAGLGQNKMALAQTMQQAGMSPEDLMALIYR